MCGSMKTPFVGTSILDHNGVFGSADAILAVFTKCDKLRLISTEINEKLPLCQCAGHFISFTVILRASVIFHLIGFMQSFDKHNCLESGMLF